MNLKATLQRLNTDKEHNDAGRSMQVDAPIQESPGSPIMDRELKNGPNESEKNPWESSFYVLL